MKVSVDQVYTAVACNRTPEITDWNSDGLICFGATNAVVIYNTREKGKDPLTVLCHHTSQVNSVKWLYKPDGTCSELVSCSADKTAAIWTLNKGLWGVTSKLSGHTDGVTCVFGIYTGRDHLVIYTGSIDSTVKVWERKRDEITLKQTISLNSGLCLTFHAHLLPGAGKPVLFCALDDHKIHVFAGNEEYHRVHSLVGHEDWVRGLDVLDADDTTIILASASQDTYIRLWRIQKHVAQTTSTEIRVEEKLFHAYGNDWSVKLDAVLAGHEGWVYGVQWHPYVVDKDTNKKRPVYRLLSSSLDKTVIVWEPEGEAGGAWVERVRAGEVGGSGLGFYGSRFGPAGDEFMAHGYNGSFHIWRLNQANGQWEPQVVCGGHFGSVEDACWDPEGRYLVSVSADQTTRLHAPWNKHGSWHELARPQVHGYDLSSLALVTPTVFASSAEEKVVRVFRAPQNFLDNFANVTGEVLAGETASGPEGASVPSLGLSNKAVFGDSAGTDEDGYFVPVTLQEPPTEETLMQQTLWPEQQKLYGHGSEVFALAASADAALLASACRAAAAAHAAPLLWDTKTWQQIQKLESHQLTVTQMEFSPDSQKLVSVSRDRRWTLYQRRQGSNLFDIAASTDKTNGIHTRIIWCCAWAHDSTMFGTGSRDGKICMWSKTATPQESSLGPYALRGAHLDVPGAAVTALALAPLPGEGATLVAAGFDSGHIHLYSFSVAGWGLLYEMGNSAAHHLAVRRLRFRPRARGRELASAGADRLLRVHRLRLPS